MAGEKTEGSPKRSGKAPKRTLQRYLGCHVSCSGGLANALINAQALSVNTIQIHPSPPQRWCSKPFASGVEAEFLAHQAESGVEAVFFHGIYLINLANPDKQMFHLSKLALVHYLELCEKISARGVIFHVGSLKDEPDETKGFERAAVGINWVLEHAPGKSPLLLEVAAGSGQVIGDTFEDLAKIYELVEQKDRVGFALDTQHMWASGYDLRNDLDGTIKKAEEVLSLKKIRAIHLNDSKTELGSRKDRHENLGDGLIGPEAMKAIVKHPKLASIPMMLETPDLKEPAGALKEVRKLLSLASD